jgi:gamma-resorcylate decarboxylase
MNGKIALEEHIESPDFPATGSHEFTAHDYFTNVQHRLREYKLRILCGTCAVGLFRSTHRRPS